MRIKPQGRPFFFSEFHFKPFPPVGRDKLRQSCPAAPGTNDCWANRPARVQMKMEGFQPDSYRHVYICGRLRANSN